MEPFTFLLTTMKTAEHEFYRGTDGMRFFIFHIHLLYLSLEKLLNILYQYV